MSDSTDKKYGTRTRTNMRSRKQKSYLPPKLHIQLTINSKRSKVLQANMMLQTMGNTHLNLRDIARIHATIHCGPSQHNNVMRNPLITTILTQYHMSKGLKFFGEPGVESVLKDLKQLHDRMVMDPKMPTKWQRVKKGSTPISNVFEAKEMRKNKVKGMCRWQKTAWIPHQGQ